MSVEQYQRSVNSLDRDIAALEKKKAEVDKYIHNTPFHLYIFLFVAQNHLRI